MSTPASSVGSSTTGTSSTASNAQTIAALLAPQTFVGVSQYSGDLQTILTRAVQIAELPVQALQTQQADMVSKISALGNLQTDVNAMATSLTSLSTVATSQGLTATSSDPTTVTATVTGSPPATTYTISDITSVAAAASETSNNYFADAGKTQVSPSGTMQLILGSQTATIHLTTATNNLQGLENAINSATDASGNSIPVTATIITAGTNEDYLSVTANNPGLTTLTLTEGAGTGGTDFLTGHNQGADTKFTLNTNISVDSQSTDINNVIPGLTFNVLQADPSGTVTVSLNPDATQLANPLSTFVSAYNTLLNDVNAQAGQNNGPLDGDDVMTTLRSDLTQLTNYTGTGAVRSLSDIGITMDDTGTMTLDPSVLQGMSSSQLQSAFAWVGSSTSGFASIASLFTQLGDPISGIIQSEVSGDNATETNLSNQVTLKATQISQMQSNLQLQLAAADSMIADLESQQNMLNTTIEAMNYSTYGYQQNPNG
jgi:flagellar hook-associated protein 2